MRKLNILLFSLLFVFLLSSSLYGQDSENSFQEQFVQQYNYTGRVLQLAEAMPADKYSWRPMEGVSSVGEVYAHIAQANYSMMDALDVSPPEGVDVQSIGSLTEKEEIVDALGQSIEFVKSAVGELPASKLSEMTEFYGRTVPGRTVLIGILSHTSEHVGQSIAYARTNGIVPPWSE